MIARQNTSWSEILSNQAMELCILGLGGWTLFANFHVLTNQNFLSLQSHWPWLLVLLFLLGLAFITLSHRKPDPLTPLPEVAYLKIRDIRLPWLVAIALVAFYALSGSYALFWLGSICFLGFYWLQLQRGAPTITYLTPKPAHPLLLPACILLAVFANLIVFRIHSDDAFYLNMIVGTLDNPEKPLLSFDDMHGISDLHLLLPVYKVQSIELLIAWLTQLTGTSHFILRNFLLPALAAPFAVLTTAIFMRRLTPNRWQETTLAAILLMIIFTAFSAGLSNYSFGKLQQGKAWLAAILIPIIIAYTIDCLTRPSAYRWLLLALAQVTAVGMSANAIYLAPLTMGLTMLGCWNGSFHYWKRFGLTSLTALYPLALGLLLYKTTRVTSPILHNSSETILLNDPELALNIGPAGYLFWLAVLVSWTVITEPARRKLVLTTATIFLAIMMNPWLIDFWAQHVAGIPTFRRLWWVIPRHLWLAILFTAPVLLLPITATRQQKIIAIIASLLVATITFAVFSSPKAVNMQVDYNQISYRWPPRPKLPEGRLEVVEKFSTRNIGRYILAPESLSRWFITRCMHVYPVVVTENYLDQLSASFLPEQIERRKTLIRYISGTERRPDAVETMSELLGDLGSVVIEDTNPWKNQIEDMLHIMKFEPVQTVGKYTLWIPSGLPATPR